MKPIITSQELKVLIDQSGVVIIDSSYPSGRETFLKGHIQNALFVDLDTDLADIQSDFKNGGRHPLPSLAKFSELLGHLGITSQSHVVVYDRNNGAFASRFWWMMRSIGHVKVQVLDGGFDQTLEAGIPTESGFGNNIEPSEYEASEWKWKVSDMKDVENALVLDTRNVFDVRGEARYKGEVEPIDLIAGHIPGALNAPFANNLTDEGIFKSAEELKSQFEALLNGVDSGNSIFHCGSGVTACHSILAVDIAGMAIPSLYVGSWSEWSRNEKPVANHE
ncbi:MAG: sulfurtransferase [Salibacteraceae bacterium]